MTNQILDICTNYDFIKILNSMNDFVFKITGIYYKILSFKIGLRRTLCL